MILKPIPQMANEMVRELPSLCTPSQLGLVLGCHADSVRRWIKSNKVAIQRTQGRHRRIPKDVQQRFAAEALRRGRA